MTARALLAGLAFALAPSLPAQEPRAEPAVTPPPPEVNLTGRWKLDPKLSDDAGDKAQEAMKGLQVRNPDRPRRPHFPDPGGYPGDSDARTPQGPGIDIMTPGMPGSAPTGDPFETGSGGYGTSGSQNRAALEHVMELPEILTIAQRPDLILVQEDDDEGRVRALRPDGIRIRATNGKSESRTKWDKGLLRVDTWHDDGVHTEEIFELAPDGKLLTVTVNVDDLGSTIALTRVFRPDPSEGG